MGIILRYRDVLSTYKTRGYRNKSLVKHKNIFPIKSNPQIAGVIGDLICDGNLQGHPKWRMDFTSKSIEELKRFEKEVYGLFSIRGKIRECSTNKFGKTFNLGINCAPIARTLSLCGVPSGQKVLKNFSIPNWIKKDKECFRRFAQRVFTCEGGIMYEENRILPQVRIELWKNKKIIKDDRFIKEIGIYLNRFFNIKSTIKLRKIENLRKDGVITQPIRMYLTGKSVVKFSKEVGFEGEKQEKMDKILGVSEEDI